MILFNKFSIYTFFMKVAIFQISFSTSFRSLAGAWALSLALHRCQLSGENVQHIR